MNMFHYTNGSSSIVMVVLSVKYVIDWTEGTVKKQKSEELTFL